MNKLLLLIIALSLPAFGEPAKTRAPAQRRPVSLPPKQWQIRVGGEIWQENVKVRNAFAEGNMETQSQGIKTSLAYLIPTRGRTWLQHYSLDVGVGTIKGKSSSTAIPDEVKGQLWLLGGFTPGLIYRTSPISSVGLMLPFAYRVIEWKLKEGTSFDPEKDSSYSVGISGAYINQLNRNNYLYIAVTHQIQWVATLWNLSWQYKF